MPIVLSLLEEADKNVRYLTAKLLAILLSNSAPHVQQAVLQTPLGIAHLTDLLRTTSDLIRNGESRATPLHAVLTRTRRTQRDCCC